MAEKVTITKTIDEFFNDYPCEWSEDRSGVADWFLTYKTGSIIGWIESPDPDSGQSTFRATFAPQGWTSDAPKGDHEAPTLEEAKDWLQRRFLDFLYPAGWQFVSPG